MQVTFPAHTAKFDALPAGSYLQGLAGMPSAEPVSLLSGITADGFCNLLWYENLKLDAYYSSWVLGLALPTKCSILLAKSSKRNVNVNTRLPPPLVKR